MVSRIKQLLDWQQLSSTQFADRIGVGRPVISHILSERNKPSLEVVQRIIAAFPDLSLPWLLSGGGSMLATEAPAPVPTPPVPAAEPAASEPPVSAAPISSQEPLPTTAAIVEAVAAPGAAAASEPPVSAAPEATLPPVVPPPFAARPAPPARFRAAPPVLEAAVVAEAAKPVAAAAPSAAPSLVPLTMAAAPAAYTPTAASLFEAPAAANDSEQAVSRPDAAVLAAGLGEPGKAIRRIVIFYRDGSFADYQPE